MLHIVQTQPDNTSYIVMNFSNGFKVSATLTKHEDGRQSYKFTLLDDKNQTVFTSNGNNFTTKHMEELIEWAVQAMYYGTDKFTGW